MDSKEYTISEIAKAMSDKLNRDEFYWFIMMLGHCPELVDQTALLTKVNQAYNTSKLYYRSNVFTPENMPAAMFLPEDFPTMRGDNVFVFGTNTEGKHDGGAAKFAHEELGAVYGKARGMLSPYTYGVVTVDYTGQEVVNFDTIKDEILALFEFARASRPELTFYVTKIGTGISGYSIQSIAGLFQNLDIPPNVILPAEFVRVDTYYYLSSKNRYYYVNDDERFMIVVDLNNFSANTVNLSRTHLPYDCASITADGFRQALDQVVTNIKRELD